MTSAIQRANSDALSPNIRLHSAQGRWILAATILGSGMVFLDGTVVNVALAPIQTDLKAPLSGLQWIVDAYALMLAALLLVGGALGDIYGRKLVYVVGLILFTLASVACGFAPSLGVLIGARAVQGIGGALLVPGSLAMIKAVIDPSDSGRAIGSWTGLSGATTAIGPLLGGYLIHAVSWRSIFFLNVPLAAVAVLITLRHVPANRDETASRDLDIPGALATVVGLGGMTYGLIEGPSSGWTSFQVLAALVVGVIALVLFPLRERLATHPMVPLDLFRSRNFTGSNLVTLGVYFSFSGAMLFLALDLQQIQGYTPLQAGAALLPITVLLLLLSPRMGGLVTRWGARTPITIGPIIIGVAFLLFILSGRTTTYLINFLPAIVVQGIGMSLFITPLTATVMSSVPNHAVGTASGVNNAVSRIAAVLAIAVLGVVVASRFDATLHRETAHLSPQTQQALLNHKDRLAGDSVPSSLPSGQQAAARIVVQNSYLDGFHWAMGTCAFLCFASGLLSALFIRGDSSQPST